MKLKKQEHILFMIVFIHLTGFGIAFPLIPILSQQFGLTSFHTALILSVYSFFQFLFAFLWGKLSDKYGRRPILLICLLGQMTAYILLGLSKSGFDLFLARSLSGVFASAVSIATACIADLTAESDRSRGMSYIGAAYGSGLIFGPAIGVGLLYICEYNQLLQANQIMFTSFFVASICLITTVFSYLNLNESLPKEIRVIPVKFKSSFILLKNYYSDKKIFPLSSIYFYLSLSLASLESVILIYTNKVYAFTYAQTLIGFSYVGFLIVFTQAYLLPKFLKKNIQHIALYGLILMLFSLLGLFYFNKIYIFSILFIPLLIGFGVSNPIILSLISKTTPSNEQGSLMGITQAVASIGRIIGPAITGSLLSYAGEKTPFAFLAIILFISILTFHLFYQKHTSMENL